MGSCEVPHNIFGPDQFNRYDVYLIQTDSQTPRQAKHIYRLNLWCICHSQEKILATTFLVSVISS